MNKSMLQRECHEIVGRTYTYLYCTQRTVQRPYAIVVKQNEYQMTVNVMAKVVDEKLQILNNVGVWYRT